MSLEQQVPRILLRCFMPSVICSLPISPVCSSSLYCSSNIFRRISALSGQSVASHGISYFVWELFVPVSDTPFPFTARLSSPQRGGTVVFSGFGATIR